MSVIKSYTKFEAIKKCVKHDISSGRYKLTERLPSERDLAVKYGVNRLTVNRALTELVQEQWLDRVNGKGTFVSNLLQKKTQNQERCQVHLVTLSLRRSIDVSFSHYALNFFRSLENVDCSVHETGFDVASEYTFLEKLFEDSECFILLVGFCDPRTRKLILDHSDRCVLLGHAPELLGKVIAVQTDFEEGGRMMMEYLISNGHCRIAFCGNLGTMPGRFHAWKTVLQENELEAPDEYVLGEVNYDLSSLEEKWCFVENSLNHFWALPDPPTAIFCSNDDLASLMIHHCWHKGLRIPDDLSVCGFDGSVAIALDLLALTTIRQPYEEIFNRAFSLLQEQTPKNFPNVLLRPTLLPGRTVKKLGETLLKR